MASNDGAEKRTPRPVVSMEQANLYAADVARLHDRVRKEEARLARLEARLRSLATTSSGLVEAGSAEAVAQRLVGDLATALEASRVAVFVLREGRFRLLAALGQEPARTSFVCSEVALGTRAKAGAGNAWSTVGFSEPRAILPFLGRGDAAVGFALVEKCALTAEIASVLDLLGRFAGMVLESHVVEETGLEALRPRAPSTSWATGPTSSGSLSNLLLGDSDLMKRVRKLVLQVAPVDSPVLVLGETGTGKELVARALHDASPRRAGPFVAINCGALPETLAESEIFGHEVGAFTGAKKKHRGKVEQASGGTLFLDELGEMSRAVQVKLLRFLQDSRYTTVGGESERTADVRIVAATNRPIEAAVAAGDFREDLLFRLNVFTIELPALHERGFDIVFLAKMFAREIATRIGRPVPTLSPAAEDALMAYRWPGNVRELRNVLERAVILASPGSAIGPEALPHVKGSTTAPPGSGIAPPAPTPFTSASSLPAIAMGEVLKPFASSKAEFVALFEARYCEAILAKAGGNMARAARLARMDRKNFARKVKQYGIDANAHRVEPTL